MRDLVPLAVTLKEAAGSFAAALEWTDVMQARGSAAFGHLGLRGDAALVLADRARAAGVLTTSGTASRVRLAQLVVVLDTLAAIPPEPPTSMRAEPLVFTVPRAAEGLVAPAQRLDLLVNDAIARAARTLHIGGAFWNERGWDLLRPVMLPALEQRGVKARFYLHPHESGHPDVLDAMLKDAASYGDVQARWWAGGYPSLMHAKFAVADGCRGYFGTANLTSLGLGEHLEIGVALAAPQAASLLTLLDALERGGLFTSERS